MNPDIAALIADLKAKAIDASNRPWATRAQDAYERAAMDAVDHLVAEVERLTRELAALKKLGHKWNWDEASGMPLDVYFDQGFDELMAAREQLAARPAVELTEEEREAIAAYEASDWRPDFMNHIPPEKLLSALFRLAAALVRNVKGESDDRE